MEEQLLNLAADYAVWVRGWNTGQTLILLNDRSCAMCHVVTTNPVAEEYHNYGGKWNIGSKLMPTGLVIFHVASAIPVVGEINDMLIFKFVFRNSCLVNRKEHWVEINALIGQEMYHIVTINPLGNEV